MILQSSARFLLSHWWTAFLLTLAVEVPLYVLMAREKVPPLRAAIAGAAGTCITHPLLWFVWRPLIMHHLLYIYSGELIVAIIESGVFFAIARPIQLRQAIACAFVANGTSYGIGLLISLWV